MVYQNLRELIDGLWFVDIKVEDVAQGVSQRVRGICLHVLDQVNQLYLILLASLLQRTEDVIKRTSQRVWVCKCAILITLSQIMECTNKPEHQILIEFRCKLSNELPLRLLIRVGD